VELELRDYQHQVVADIGAALAAGQRRLLLTAPTGAGKTVIAAELVRRALGNRSRVLFLARRRELIHQASKKFCDVGLDHGILLPGFPMRLYEPLQVASIATLHARAIRTNKIEFPPADMVVIDEAHHARTETYCAIVEAYPNAAIVGLTATPCREDGRGLGNVFQKLIECPPVHQLVKAGYLVGTVVYAPSTPDLRGVRVERGDYVESQLAQRMDNQKLVGDVVEQWLKLSERRRTVVFATGVKHSLHIRDEFRLAGVLAEHVDGATPTDERDAILRRLAAGDIDLVTNAMVLTEGWDSPDVSCLVLARPTRSLGLFRQMVGRVLRPAPGKTNALILDHAGASFTHGLVEDPIEWTLSEDHHAINATHATRGSSPEAPALTACPECHAVRHAGKPCGSCGWRPQEEAKSVIFADGELGRVERNRSVRVITYTAEEKARFYKQLLWIATERRYKPSLAAHKYKDKFGDWPATRPWEKPEPEVPDAAVRSWVRSRQIAYAKSMRKSA
jgi:DNA repair protein RadD